MPKPHQAILFFNPKSGHSRLEHHLEMIKSHFANQQIELETILVPKTDAAIADLINSAIEKGVTLFIAAGGDGTIAMVGTHLIGKDLPLGIIPLGTGNLLSKALGIPQKIDPALDLITSDQHEIIKIDTFKLDDRFYLMNVSVGVSPKIMQSSDSNQKQQIGFFAYLINFIQQLLGLKLHRFSLEYDHKKTSALASEILITNIGTACIDPLMWDAGISLNDGFMDLLIFRATNVWDVFGVIASIFLKRGKLNPVVRYLKVKEYCKITTQTPMKTQADGDVVGKTPFTIHVYPNSLTVIAGKDYQSKHEGSSA